MRSAYPSKVPFSLTHVEYTEGDVLGWVFALITLTPIFVMVMYATLLCCRRDAQTAFGVAGQCMCVLLAALLKCLIKQPRPNSTSFEGHGMPSNHSMFIGYFCTHTLIHLLPCKAAGPSRFITCLALALLGLLVCCSRVYLGYHTIPQVMVGALVGCVFAFLWRKLYNMVGFTLCHELCDSAIGRWLCIRDYTSVSYAPVDEYHALCVHAHSH